jgi:uncharacterized protein DUF3850
MKHLAVRCWADTYDAIVSGRSRAICERPDHFQPGDTLELVRWDPASNTETQGTCEVLITHVARSCGPFALMGLRGERELVPLRLLSFVFLHGDFTGVPLGESDYCRTGAWPAFEQAVDRP